MDDNNEFHEDFIRVMGLYNQYQQLKYQQIQRILQQMDRHKEQILNFCSLIYCFLHRLQNLFPNDNQKLKKKSIKNQWIKVFLNFPKIQYMFHQDYCTYVIYNKIPIPPKNKSEQIIQLDILSEFQNLILQQICQINEKFAESMIQIHQYSQDYIQLQFENFQYYQIIEHLNYDIDDVLTSQQQQDIDNYMRIAFSQIINKQFQIVVDLIKNSYQDFISQTEIEPSEYPSEFCYKNFGNGLNVEQLKQNKQIQIQKIINNQDISKLEIGVYSIQVKKSIIILEITTNEKNAYIFNYFNHYKNTSSIFEKLDDFKILRINTIKLDVEECYYLIKFLQKKNNLSYQQNQIIQIYQKEIFEEINQQIEFEIQKKQKHEQIQKQIQMYIPKIIQNSNNYKDIYSLEFIQQLQQQKNFDFDLIPIIEFDFDLNKPQFSSQLFGAILEDKQKSLSGVVIYINGNQLIVYMKNTNDILIECFQQQNKDTEIIINKSKFNRQNEDQIDYFLKIKKRIQGQKYIIIEDTNIKEISTQVAQFYVSLLINKQQQNVIKNIKDFLELKNNVWNNILQFLE